MLFRFTLMLDIIFSLFFFLSFESCVVSTLAKTESVSF